MLLTSLNFEVTHALCIDYKIDNIDFKTDVHLIINIIEWYIRNYIDFPLTFCFQNRSLKCAMYLSRTFWQKLQKVCLTMNTRQRERVLKRSRQLKPS